MYTDEVLAFTGLVQKEFDLKFFSLQIIADMILVYINLYLLIPKYLSRKRIGTYMLGTLSTILLALLSNYFIIMTYVPDVTDIVVVLFRSFLLTMGILGTAISIKIIKKTLNNQQKLRSLEKLNYEAEVNYLKMQVNPHFLFNTLNNIYVQSKKYPSSVPDSIMKLSDLMRYQIYNGSKDEVSLQEEMKFIRDYLDLEQMRRDNIVIDFKFDLSETSVKVSPLLFIPLVENAIKHSFTDGAGVVNIEVYCAVHGSEVIFDITNTIGSQVNKQPGIGLSNLRRRLSILYPEKHVLNISQKADSYIASLRLHTHD